MLNIHSKYSIKYGVKSPHWILEWANKNKYEQIAITDINSTTAILNSIKLSQEIGIKIVAGTDIRNGIEQKYVLLAKNNRGFHEINTFITTHLHEDRSFPDQAEYLANCITIYPLKNTPDKLKINEYVGIRPHQVNKLTNDQKTHRDKLVILQTMTFEVKREFNAHRLLRAIDHNCLLSKLSINQQADHRDTFIKKRELYDVYSAFPDIIERTEKVLKACSIHFGFGDEVEAQNIHTYTGTKPDDKRLLRSLCEEGLSHRYPTITATVRERIDRELDVIDQKDYLAYFLVTWDIINYATSKGYFHVGRGSGANSIVAYLLGITDVDPLELDLYFERFINVYRKNPPDFDIDFSWRERDEVIRYIFKRFPNAALLCTYNTFKYRATVRELGKVFGLPKTDIDLLSRGKYNITQLDEMNQLVLKYSSYIEGLPSHLSVHSGGIIISERPTTWFSATFLPPKGFPTTQFSMLEAEDVGLYKFDILSQRGLSKIHESIDIIKYNRPEEELHDIHDVNHFKKDPKVCALLQNGEAMGCFYVESPAMRQLMKKLKTQTYLELVAASSIIRPGVSDSGMMREYILRHKSEERRKQAHPELYKIMPETYGVMVYQEDVIKVAHLFAGLTLDEADVLRRGMSGKYRSRKEFQTIKNKFFQNCIEKGYGDKVTTSIWKQIESFAGYAFSKGHSASYAVESFQSLYLKAYFPIEYMVATINNSGGYYRTEFYIHEARRQGATIEPPCVQKSSWNTVIEETTVYLGFNLISGIGSNDILKLLQHRKASGVFTSFEEFLKRTYLSIENVLLLVRIGAFRRLSTEKQQLKWRTHLFYKMNKRVEKQPELFETPNKKYDLPSLLVDELEQAFEEMELLGFPLCNPFLLLNEQLSPQLKARDFRNYEKQCITLYGYLVAIKNTKTNKNEHMAFGTFIDYWGTYFETVHFPPTLRKHPFQGHGIYLLYGKITEEFGYYSLEIIKSEKLIYTDDPRYTSE
jgi:DNA polymerase-3 subunit alpha